MKVLYFLNLLCEIAVYAIVFFIPFSKTGIEICAYIAIVSWLLRRAACYGFRVHKYFPRTPLNGPIVVLLAVYAGSTLLSVNLNLSLEGLFLKFGESILLFFVFYDFISDNAQGERRVNFLLRTAAVSALLVFSDSIFQGITGRDFLRGFTSSYRLRGPFDTPNGLAAWLIVIIPLLWTVFFGSYKKNKCFNMKEILYLVLSLTGVGILMVTFSRGAWLGFLAGSCLMACLGWVCKEKVIKIFSFFVIAVLMVSSLWGFLFFKPVKNRMLSLNEGFEKAGFKKYVWREALSIIEDFPVLGTGPNTYTYVGVYYKLKENTGYYPHNSYLHMAAETGLLGLGAFLWLIWRFFGSGIKKVKEKADILLLALMGGILAFLIQSFFDTNIYALQFAVLFWIMLGAATARFNV